MVFVAPERLDALAREHADFLAAAAPQGLERTVACVVGARMVERRVGPEIWAAIVQALQARGKAVTLVWGPGERELAEAVQRLAPSAHLAPPSTLDQAAVLFSRAAGVVGHDTGTSHLAVAAGAATFVMFVCEAPTRYGHLGPRRVWIDLRQGVDRTAILSALDGWLTGS
jgi:heptosyltransferase-1